MNNVTNVSVAGFYHSGASAVVDFLTEFDNISIALEKDEKGNKRDYEHKIFSLFGTLFYLADTLLGMNSLLVADKAINTFIDINKKLYANNFGGFGSYQKLLGTEYWKAVEEFLVDIEAEAHNGRNMNHYTGTRFSLFRGLLQIAAKIIYKRPIGKFGKKAIPDNKPVYYTFPTEEQLCTATKKFCNNYFKLCNKENKEYCVFDQLIYPRQIPAIDKYIGESFKAIFVYRDIREIYFGMKYISSNPYTLRTYFPTDIDKFVKIMKGHLYIPKHNTETVLFVSFNDLVYKYEDTAKVIMNFLGLDKKFHTHEKMFFNPDRSLINTQAFRMKPEYLEESEKIRALAPELCYDFPYHNETSLKEIFDERFRTKPSS